ncbi:aldo/keto reductase family oxidoreductase [soil metagenome]
MELGLFCFTLLIMPAPLQPALLSPAGPEVSPLVYGTWRILDDDGDGVAAPARLAECLATCIDLGITTLDTAEIYGGYRVEAALGDALRHDPGLRRKLQVVTKAGIDVPSAEKAHARLSHYNATAQNLVACAEKSLRHLGVEVLDLFLVHRPDWLTPAADTAAGLDRLLESGKIRHVGVSNYSTHQFDTLNALMGGRLRTNQVELSPLAMGAMEDGTLQQCERLGIRPMAWSPLGGGRIFDQQDAAAGRVRAAFESIRARYHGADDAALSIAWIMAHPSRPIPVIGTNRPARIRSAGAASGIAMERQDWYAVWEAAAGRPVP